METIEQIESAMAELEAKRNQLAEESRRQAFDEIAGACTKANLSAELLAAAFSSAAKACGYNCKITINKAKPPSPIKYRNPADSSQTWSGRGKSPAWFDKSRAAEFAVN